ncbi:MAG: nucleotidyltransferase domain-containing protein [Bacteroidales bacterium]|nr:nucleotidyltransferase domain-containing protein [Bacteroidales bacterium]
MISQTNVLLSGSYASGTQTPNSDMDFIVISENVTFFIPNPSLSSSSPVRY